jgi:hypothetical protein
LVQLSDPSQARVHPPPSQFSISQVESAAHVIEQVPPGQRIEQSELPEHAAPHFPSAQSKSHEAPS